MAQMDAYQFMMRSIAIFNQPDPAFVYDHTISIKQTDSSIATFDMKLLDSSTRETWVHVLYNTRVQQIDAWYKLILVHIQAAQCMLRHLMRCQHLLK